MDKLIIGILAHVDAGKTTLSESLLYLSGKIKKMGRVDNKDAFLDTFELEKARGITIFSKQAILEIDDKQITLLDSPGHVDFSAEMERTLQVLDYAILVISGADGVQGHTKTLWRLLEIYDVPTFIFINKMDQNGTDKRSLMTSIRSQLDERCIAFDTITDIAGQEALAMCDDAMMATYLETGQITKGQIDHAVKARKVIPCYFGSALKLDGVDDFMKDLALYTKKPIYPSDFGAKVYKISRDDQGNRLTHLKVTGGTLKVKDVIKRSTLEDKVNQIRIYSGTKFEAVSEVEAGSICAVTGPSTTRAGEGLGIEASSDAPILEPVLSYQLILPEGIDARMMMPKLRQIEEEDPMLKVVWHETLGEIQVQIMGEVQIEILQSLIQSRFDVTVSFDAGRIVYKESISDVVEGVGHFEPLRHYAEAHLLLEPGESGSGLIFESICSEEQLGRNWQNLVLNHLHEKAHIGVLTGSELTDVKITLVTGRANNRHTVGGDFREATYRAVRQGLMEAQSVLLEPYYAFQLELPEKMVGRAMTDIEKMNGSCEITESNGETTTLTGRAPVVAMRHYQTEVIAYTKGHGRLFTTFSGYDRCTGADDVIASIGYDPDRDLDNPTGSVFCTQGAGYTVPWHEVKAHMHVDAYLKTTKSNTSETIGTIGRTSLQSHESGAIAMSVDEIDAIINSTYYSNQGRKSTWKKPKTARESYYESVRYVDRRHENKEDYLIVDGYNIVFAWPELADLAVDNLDAARAKLLDILSNYQGMHKGKTIVVFDAYRVEGRRQEMESYRNLLVVYTSEAQTADLYIEKFSHQNASKYHITVATSDGLQQMIIRGAGCDLLSARELKEAIDASNERIRQDALIARLANQNVLSDALSPEEKEQLKRSIKTED
jgi:small GTP-binding protein